VLIVINTFLIANFVDHIVRWVLSGESTVRNIRLLYHPCHRIKDQPSIKLTQMNICIIKLSVIINFWLPKLAVYQECTIASVSTLSNTPSSKYNATAITSCIVNLARRLFYFHTICAGGKQLF
jgi:hypothetical protein